MCDVENLARQSSLALSMQLPARCAYAMQSRNWRVRTVHLRLFHVKLREIYVTPMEIALRKSLCCELFFCWKETENPVAETPAKMGKNYTIPKVVTWQGYKLRRNFLELVLSSKRKQNKGKQNFSEGAKLFRISSVPFFQGVALFCDHLNSPPRSDGPR